MTRGLGFLAALLLGLTGAARAAEGAPPPAPPAWDLHLAALGGDLMVPDSSKNTTLGGGTLGVEWLPGWLGQVFGLEALFQRQRGLREGHGLEETAAGVALRFYPASFGPLGFVVEGGYAWNFRPTAFDGSALGYIQAGWSLDVAPRCALDASLRYQVDGPPRTLPQDLEGVVALSVPLDRRFQESLF